MYATLIKGLDILFIFLSRAELYKLLLFGGKKSTAHETKTRSHGREKSKNNHRQQHPC